MTSSTVVYSTDDTQLIVAGVLLVTCGCLLGIPLLHYWIDPRP